MSRYYLIFKSRGFLTPPLGFIKHLVCFQKCPSASGDVSPDAPFFYLTLVFSGDASTEVFRLYISGKYFNNFARQTLLPHSCFISSSSFFSLSLSKNPKISNSTKHCFFHSSSTQSINYNHQQTPNSYHQ